MARAYQKPGRPPCTVEGCEQSLYCRGLCTMHYLRLRQTGDVGGAERLRGPIGSGSVTREGYHVTRNPAHPLATAQGKVATHRAVLFDTIGPGPHPCHWCNVSLTWHGSARGRINADHLDHDRLNNDPSNLVPSCLDCNTKRRVAA